MSRSAGAFKRVAVIANPASGQSEPILSRVNRLVVAREVNWWPYVTTDARDLSNLIDQIQRWQGCRFEARTVPLEKWRPPESQPARRR